MADELTQVVQDSAVGGFFLVSGTALATVIMAIASILIARFLGPELYGQYALALVIPQLLFLFADLGINNGITKFTADLQAKGEANRIPNLIKHGLILRTVMGVGIFIISYVFADVIAPILVQRADLGFYVRLASISVLFQVIFTTLTSAFVGLDKTEFQALTTNIQATAKTIVCVVLILIGLGVSGAIIGYITGYVVASAIGVPLLFVLMRRKKKPSESGNFKTNVKILFHYGMPIYMSILLTGFIPLFKNMVLAFFTTDVDIGNYRAAINFGALLMAIAGPMTAVLLPAFSKLNSKTNRKIKQFFKIANKYTSMIMLPVTLLIIIFSKEIVQIIYGATYGAASMFLSVYCLMYLFVGVGYLTLPSLYNGLGETKTTLQMSLISFIVIVFLSVPLTQNFGVQGLLLAFLISIIASTIYGAHKARKKFHVDFDFPRLIKVYVVSVVSSVAPILLGTFVSLPSLLNVGLGGFLYLFSYVTLLPLAKVITSSEIEKTVFATQNTKFLALIIRPVLRYQRKILQLKANSKKSPKFS